MEKENPLVSVIIPTYNGEKYLEKAIESVLAQSYKNIEIIIVDDGSIDKTFEIISKYKKQDSRIRSLKNDVNLGFVKSLNRGIKEARGIYIARLDDDDFWLDEKKLEKQVCFLENNPDYILVGGGAIRFSEKGEELSRYLLPQRDEEIRKTALIDNPFVHSSVVFRKKIWEEVGGYDENFGFFSDRDLWLKMGRKGKMYNFQEYFVYYMDKEVAQNYKMRNLKIRRQLKKNLELRKKYRNDYPGYLKAYLLCLASYFYSFIPFNRKLWGLFFFLRKLIIGPPSYRYLRTSEEDIFQRLRRNIIPEPIKRFFRPLYHKLTIRFDEELIKDLMEYFSMDRKRVIYFLKNGGYLSRDFWYCAKPKTEEEIKNFYKENPFYVFNLAFWHSTRYQRRFRSKIIELAKGSILDYGAGIGDLCLKLAEKGLEVDYADLPGRTFNFAQWLFQKRGYKISMIDLEKTGISKKYDTIFCIDVIEHVHNPKSLLKDLTEHLAQGGYLIITGLHPVIGEKIPLHFPLQFDPEGYLKSLGMTKGDYPFLWIKK